MIKKTLQILGLASILFAISCEQSKQVQENTESAQKERIVSLSGTTTEILCALGLQDQIVGTDVTSTYPEAVAQLPKVGHNRNISAEAVIALKPSLVIGVAENIKPELAEQLRSAHTRVLLYKLESSVEGTKSLIKNVADSMGKSPAADPILQQIDKDLEAKASLTKKTKVLFIYARGAGTMMVAGRHTFPNSMIGLAGGENAVQDFEDFKPLTPEALLKANPDVILMFNSGLESLGGIEGLLKVPGIGLTNAGKNKQVIEMDGQYLTGFGPRLGKAIAELSTKLDAVNKH